MSEDTELVPVDDDRSLARAGEAANEAAARSVFIDYLSRRADATLRRQSSGLALFADFIGLVTGERPYEGSLQSGPTAWIGVTWGLVEGFRQWMLQEGYAVGTVNVRLSTVKVYARLAAKAGAIPADEIARIDGIQGYSRSEARHVDEKRDDAGRATRVGRKKPDPVSISPETAAKLLDQPLDTPQGRRDRLMMCLLLEHGLRVGEVAALTVDCIDWEHATLHFWREKVSKEQIHRLTARTYEAAWHYYDAGDAPEEGPLLRASRRGGELTHAGLSKRSITKRVMILGRRIGVRGLSAHDCRHFWATHAARSGTDPFALQEAGGWASLAMPRRYIEEAEIANEGLRGFDMVEESPTQSGNSQEST